MSQTSEGRRRLIKALGAGAVAVTATWQTPVIEAQTLPLHAQASPPPPPPDCPRGALTGGSGCPE